MRGQKWRHKTEQVSAKDASGILRLAMSQFTIRHVSRMMLYSGHSPGVHHLLTDRKAHVPLWRLDLLLRALDGYVGQEIVVEASPGFGG